MSNFEEYGAFKQGHRYHNPGKLFSKYYRRHYDLMSKYNDGLK